MIFTQIILKLFVCQCKDNYGVKDLMQLENNRIVGKCLKCNKRVYGKILYKCKELTAMVDKTSGVKNG